MPLSLKDLGTSGGVETLHRLVGSTGNSDNLQRIKDLIKQTLAQHPGMSDMPVEARQDYPNASYSFTKDTLTTGMADPDVLAHELGHAKNLRGAKLYQKLLFATKGLSALGSSAAIPIMLGLRAFASDPAQRDDILNTLSGASAAAAAPELVEEASATADAIINSPEKLQTAGKLLPPLAAHAIHNLIPSLLYQLDRRL